MSAEYSLRKPNPMLFEMAAARLGLHPQDIWFVGDRLDTDVAGARAAGMRAIWFNPGGAADAAGSANLSVSSWAEFLRKVAEAQ